MIFPESVAGRVRSSRRSQCIHGVSPLLESTSTGGGIGTRRMRPSGWAGDRGAWSAAVRHSSRDGRPAWRGAATRRWPGPVGTATARHGGGMRSLPKGRSSLAAGGRLDGSGRAAVLDGRMTPWEKSRQNRNGARSPHRRFAVFDGHVIRVLPSESVHIRCDAFVRGILAAGRTVRPRWKIFISSTGKRMGFHPVLVCEIKKRSMECAAFFGCPSVIRVRIGSGRGWRADAFRVIGGVTRQASAR